MPRTMRRTAPSLLGGSAIKVDRVIAQLGERGRTGALLVQLLDEIELELGVDFCSRHVSFQPRPAPASTAR